MTGGARPLLAALALAACHDDAAPPPPYAFVDATREAGLADFRQTGGSAEKPFIVETVGGGVALFDAEGDGDLDLYLTNGSSFAGFAPGAEPADALYVNDGRGRFADATERAGVGDRSWTMGVRAVDLEGDGDEDLYLTNDGPNVLYKNRGDGTFEDGTAASGLGDPRWSTGACFLDFDRDGDLDLYLANYVDFDRERMLRERPTTSYKGVAVMKGPIGLAPAEHAFYVNDGTETFHDASAEVGIAGHAAFGFECVTFDVDQDGWLDVYVANDSVANFLWRNEAGQRFVERAFQAGAALSIAGRPQSGMGVAVGDGDGDLVPDLYVTNFSDDYSTFYRGDAHGFFVDATQRLGLAEATMSDLAWACGFEDFDADGDVELWAVNGHVYPQVDRFEVGTSYAQPARLFELVDGSFRVPAGAGGPGFTTKRVGRGAAVGDVDQDGDQDLLIETLDGPPALLLNEGPQGHWISLELVERGKNRDAIGARLVGRVGERRMLRLVGTSSGFLSSSDRAAHFGLGSSPRLEELEITWPDGTHESLRDLGGDARWRIERTAGAARATRAGG